MDRRLLWQTSRRDSVVVALVATGMPAISSVAARSRDLRRIDDGARSQGRGDLSPQR